MGFSAICVPYRNITVNVGPHYLGTSRMADMAFANGAIIKVICTNKQSKSECHLSCTTFPNEIDHVELVLNFSVGHGLLSKTHVKCYAT